MSMSNAFTNYAQNQGYNIGAPTNFQTMGFAPNPQQMDRPRMENPLTDEELKFLKENADEFNLKVSGEEMAKAICTHKDSKTGTFTIVPNSDGSVTCKLCHQTFYPDEVTEEYANEVTKKFLNFFETCKLIGVDLPKDVIRTMCPMIAYIKKMPQLFKLVNQRFARYTNTNIPIQNTPGSNILNTYNMLMSPGVPIGAQYNNGYNGGYAYNQYMGQPQPQTPFMNMQNNMVGGNPFYQPAQYGGSYNPYVDYQQQMQQAQYNSVPPVQQPQPSAQAAPQQASPQQQAQPQPQNNPAPGEQVTINKQLGL